MACCGVPNPRSVEGIAVRKRYPRRFAPAQGAGAATGSPGRRLRAALCPGQVGMDRAGFTGGVLA